MLEQQEHGVSRVPVRQLSQFAESLFGYLYQKLHMCRYRLIPSPHFNEVIGESVLCIRNATRDFNTRVLDSCGYGVSRLVLCQEVCNLYPKQDYFKKLYFISAFILEVMFWCYESSNEIDFGLGPNLWQAIFRDNFEEEFENHGGWEELLQAGTHCHNVLLNEVFPSESILPAFLEGVIERVRELNPSPEQAIMDEAIASLESLQVVGQMEIDDSSVDESAQSTQSEEGIEENQPGKVAQAEGSKKENQPHEVGERSSAHSSALRGILAQTENPVESTSGEEVLPNLGDGRKLGKRRRSTPPEDDSNAKSDSLSSSKAKMGKK